MRIQPAFEQARILFQDEDAGSKDWRADREEASARLVLILQIEAKMMCSCFGYSFH